MATAIRDGAVLANVASISVSGSTVTAYVQSVTHQGAPVDIGDGIFIYVNAPATDDLSVQQMVGHTVRHLAGA